jgi:hypothetical protein
MAPIMLSEPIGLVDGLFGSDGSRRAPSTKKFRIDDGDVEHQQRRDGFVDAAVVAQRADAADPQPARQHGGERHHAEQQETGRPVDHRNGDRGSGKAAEHQRPLAADNDEPEPRRDGHAQRRENERRGAHQRVLPGKAGAEAAAPDQREEVHRRLAQQQQEHREKDARHDQRQQRNDHIFRRASDPVQKIGRQTGSNGHAGRFRGICHTCSLKIERPPRQLRAAPPRSWPHPGPVFEPDARRGRLPGAIR